MSLDCGVSLFSHINKALHNSATSLVGKMEIPKQL